MHSCDTDTRRRGGRGGGSCRTGSSSNLPIDRQQLQIEKGWAPLAGDALLDRLRFTGRPRLSAGADGIHHLREYLRTELAALFDQERRAGKAPLILTKGRLRQALAGCTDPEVSGYDRHNRRQITLAMACGSLIRALFRQLVTQGSIGDPMTDAMAALALCDHQAEMTSWIDSLPPQQQRELTSEVRRQAIDLATRWPALRPEWLPRTDVPIHVDLAEGAVHLAARVDLAVGHSGLQVASMGIVEVKSGSRSPDHRLDLHFSALAEMLRSSAPPFVGATYYTRTGELDVEPVSEDLLVSAAERALDGVRAILDRPTQRPPSRNGGIGFAGLPDFGPGPSLASGSHGGDRVARAAQALTAVALAPIGSGPTTSLIRDDIRSSQRHRLRHAVAQLVDALPSGAPIVITLPLLRRVTQRGETAHRSDLPFAWKPVFVRRSLGLAAIQACLDHRFRTPIEAIPAVAEQAVREWERSGSRTFHWEPWFSALSTGARAAVLADATTWSSTLWTCFDWGQLSTSSRLGGPDTQWACSGSRTIRLKSRSEVRFPLGDSTSPGLCTPSEVLVSIASGVPTQTWEAELAYLALIAIVGTASGPVPARVIGIWPDAGQHRVIEITEERLAKARDLALAGIAAIAEPEARYCLSTP